MSGHHRPGRRRRPLDEDVRPEVPAPSAQLAQMWASVSAAHGTRARRARMHQLAMTDFRLTDQVTLLPMLHEWQAVTDREVEELTFLLQTYAITDDEQTREEAAELASTFIRSMARRRARSRPFPRVTREATEDLRLPSQRRGADEPWE